MEAHKGLRFRQAVLGVTPTAAGVLLVAGMLVTPWEGGGEGQLTAYYTNLAAHPGRAQVSTLLIAFGYLLMVPALFAMLQLTKHRGTRLGNAGWLLGTLGFGLMAGIAAVIDIYDMVLAQELGVSQAVALSEKMEALPAVAVVGMSGAFGSFLGIVFMGAALWRSREVPVWGPAGLGLSAVALFLGSPALIPMTVAATALLVGCVAVTLRILRADDWEHGGPVLPTSVPVQPVREPVA